MRKVWPLPLLAGAVVACGGNGSSGSTTHPHDGGAAADASAEAAYDGEAGSSAGDADAGGDASAAPDAVADGPSGDTGGPVAPTVSSWLGTNVSADLPYVDVTYLLKPFDTASPQLDANGYPVAGASGQSATDIGFILPTGTYKISFVGSGSLTVSGIGALGGAWQSAGGEERNTISITGTPGAFGHFLNLKITNGASQTVQQIHVYMPGFDYDSTTTFTPQFVRVLAPFRALRFMDWEQTNNSTLANFSDRPSSAHFGQSAYGQPYEFIAELVNETGKDCWITVPEAVTDSFISQFASFMASHLDMTRIQAARSKAGFAKPFQLIVEDSNETWNGGFSAYNTFLTAANANAARYTGTYTGTYGPSWMSSNASLMKVGQYHADRLVKIGNAFRSAFGANASVVAPVLSGWALGTVYSDVGLTFIQSNYGNPKNYVTYVAQAPYFDLPSESDASGAALGTLFTALGTSISGMDTTFKDFAKLGTQYGIGIVAYEGGQSLTGTTNQTIKHLAQHDVRMYDAYKSYYSLWKQDFGTSLFMHFSLAGNPGIPETIYQYGYWGSIIGVMEDPATCEPNLPTLTGSESIASVVHHCPKYRALSEYVPQ
jgi:hypothetical protein